MIELLIASLLLAQSDGEYFKVEKVSPGHIDAQQYDPTDDVDDIKNDLLALEFFLSDKSDHAKLCPNISWDQPPIEIYKIEPKSYLPDNCEPNE